ATGYQLNVIAQSLRQQHTNTIAHILESAAPNPFFIHVSLGAKAMAHEHLYHMLEYNVQHDPLIEQKAVETFISRRVDAILFTTPLNADNVLLAQTSGIPVVQVEKPCIAGTDAVLVDNYSGVRAAIDHLLALGHRRIAFSGVDPANRRDMAGYSDRERFGGYADALADYGLDLVPEWVAFGESYSSEDTISVGCGWDSAHRLLTLDNPPTDIFAAGDNIAAGVMQAIHAHGLRVPDDISVIGFDDTYSPYLAPPLTTVRMPMHDMGREAIRMVLQRISQGDALPPQTRTLKTELLVRQSTAAPKS
ncbi:MAG: substrate-binding domain-containing protein, partial [Anaerolineae bacterium]|nr:substrate-binding domain-containing protein [Anaerolineae bacterium]